MAEGSLVTVARMEEVQPGTLRTVAAGDEDVTLAHCDGEIYAVQSKCLHLEGPLGEGHLEECVLTCPWHGWQYDVRTGENEFDRAIKLETYPVTVEDGEVRVDL
jgi:nitrite reductase (NADH) small subunit